MSDPTDPADHDVSGGYPVDDVDEYAAVPIPAIVAWDTLTANTYRQQLGDLADWVTWYVRTYRVQPAVVPPCWYRHPGHLETLSHLHVGWQLTRHPDAGVGMIGLEWDARRVAAQDQLRDLTAVSNCDSTQHTEPYPIPWLDHPNLADAFRTHLADHAADADNPEVTSTGIAASSAPDLPDSIVAALNRYRNRATS